MEEVNIVVKEKTKEAFTSQAGKELERISITDEEGNVYSGLSFQGDPEKGTQINIKFVTGKFGRKIVDMKTTAGKSLEVNNTNNTITNIKTEVKIMAQKDSKEKKESTNTTFTIKGTVWYAHVKEPQTKGRYPSNAFQLDLSIDDAHVKALTELGVQVKNKGDEKGNFVTLKSKKVQPKVTNVDGEDVTGQILIGNGSTATIRTTTYDNSEVNIKAGKGGRKMLGLGPIQLDTLVEFEAKPLV